MELIANALRNSSNQGELVIDLFGGSGSTLMLVSRQPPLLLMELDPKYCDVIIDRWETLTGEGGKAYIEAEWGLF